MKTTPPVVQPLKSTALSGKNLRTFLWNLFDFAPFRIRFAGSGVFVLLLFFESENSFISSIGKEPDEDGRFLILNSRINCKALKTLRNPKDLRTVQAVMVSVHCGD